MAVFTSSQWEKLAASCLRADAALRANRSTGLPVDSPTLHAVVSDLVQRGVPMAAALQATATVATAAAGSARARGRLVAAWRWRIGMCVGAGTLARCIHMGGVTWAPAPYARVDVAALSLAVALVVSMRWWLAVALPRPWLDEARLAAWCAAYAGGDYSPGAPAAAVMAICRWREESGGMSMLSSRHAALRAWCQRREDQAAARLERLADVLPVVELAGGGVAALLIMLAPLLASLAA